MEKQMITQRFTGNRFRMILLLLMVFFISNGKIYSADPASTIVDIVVNSADHTTLKAAVIAAELADDLSGEGPFTLFAPTDAAFAALPAGTIESLLADPTGQLADILKYHVVSGKIMSGSLSDGQMATTLLGKDFTVTKNADGVFINNAKVTVADIEADNGVVHVINAVLSLPTGIFSESRSSLSFNIYPNPVREYLTLNISDPGFSGGTLQIFNSAGTKLLEREIQDVNDIIDVRGFKSGVYFLRANSSEAITTKKFVIK